jgi:chromosome segregation ATPase
MWQTVLKWVLPYVLQQLEGYLDPEEQARVAAYKSKRDELGQKEQESQAVIAALETDIQNLQQQQQQRQATIVQAQFDIGQLDLRLKEIGDEKQKKLSDLNSLSDDAVLHSSL